MSPWLQPTIVQDVSPLVLLPTARQVQHNWPSTFFSLLFCSGGAFHSHFMCCMCQNRDIDLRHPIFFSLISVAHSCSPYSPILNEDVREDSQMLCVSVLCMCECPVLSFFFLFFLSLFISESGSCSAISGATMYTSEVKFPPLLLNACSGC